MSNYLKKLAYVHDAMKKMAYNGPNMGNFEGNKVPPPAMPITLPPTIPAKVKLDVTKPVASTSATGTTSSPTPVQQQITSAMHRARGG